MSIPIRLVTYPWFNDPRCSHERERKCTGRLSTVPGLSRDIATGGHCQKTTPERTKHPPPCRTNRTVSFAPHRVAERAPGWSCLSNMATTRPPISLVAYSRSEATRERRRQDEILGREGGSRRDSPPPPDRRTYHRGRTMLDESEAYDDRRRLRVRDRASRGASRDCGGVRGGNPREGEASRGVDGAMAPVFRNYAPGLGARGEREPGGGCWSPGNDERSTECSFRPLFPFPSPRLSGYQERVGHHPRSLLFPPLVRRWWPVDVCESDYVLRVTSGQTISRNQGWDVEDGRSRGDRAP